MDKEIMSVKSELIKLAAQMALCTNMPSDCHEDWDWPKGMQITSWRKVYDASTKSHEQCRSWAVALSKLADRLEN